MIDLDVSALTPSIMLISLCVAAVTVAGVIIRWVLRTDKRLTKLEKLQKQLEEMQTSVQQITEEKSK